MFGKMLGKVFRRVHVHVEFLLKKLAWYSTHVLMSRGEPHQMGLICSVLNGVGVIKFLAVLLCVI